jgi:hypothetical protein
MPPKKSPENNNQKLLGVIPVAPISHEKKKGLMAVTCVVGIVAANLPGGITLAEIAGVGAVFIAIMPETRETKK